MNKREIIIRNDISHATDELVNLWRSLALQSVNRQGRFCVALSGGRTPAIFLQRLVEKGFTLPWRQTHIFQVDERFVAPASAVSNQLMLREVLIEPLGLEQNFHAINTGLDSNSLAAQTYEQEVKTFFGSARPRFDLIILGIGADGHTASLFPGGPELNDAAHLIIPTTSPAEPQERISMSLSLINASSRIIFLVTGVAKAQVVQQVVDGTPHMPASRIQPHEGQVSFILDSAAASRLKH